jgi:hypothetical protein
MAYHNATPIETTELCQYGCSAQAKFKFLNGKYCCAAHYNACNSKREKANNRTQSQETIQKIKNRPKEVYKKPKAESVETTELCQYGCGKIALFKFTNGKYCCSKSHNSCQGKRDAFSELDHTDRTAKSLTTRLEKGITKSSRAKAHQTMLDNDTYKVIGRKLQEKWQASPWQNNIQCPIIPYKDTTIKYQGTHEYDFLEKLESEHGLTWLLENVKRGPSLWYIDPTDNTERLYISDFIIYNTIYEIKSAWTWNRHGKDAVLEAKNRAKLSAAKKEGFTVVLVLDKEHINA